MKILLAGGSKGLGKEILCQLTRHTDHHVVYMCRTRGELVEIREKIEWLELDLEWSGLEIETAIRAAAIKLGGIDALIVSSGAGAYHPISVGEETIKKLFQVNTIGPILVYNAAFRYLMKSRGKAIFLTSIASRKPGDGGLSLYAGTKGAVHGWLTSEARRAAEAGVGLCAIAPGFIETPMTEKMKPKKRETSTKAIPFGRFGGVGEIAMPIKDILEWPNWSLAGSILEFSGGA